MTQAMADSTSPDSSWDGSEFPPATEYVETQLPPDKTEIINPPAKVCPTCGEEVLRTPGQRGRVAKYHPECRPSKAATSISGSPRVVRVSKQEQIAAEQVEILIEQARTALGKAVMLLSIVEPYDAFVLHVNSIELLANLRVVLMRFEWARSAALNAQTGGSVFGLFLTMLTTALPILAHHNLIPAKKVAAILINLPIFMQRMQERAAENDGDITGELMRRIQEEQRKATEARMRRETAESMKDGSH